MFTNMVIIVNDVAAPFQPHVLLISNHPCSHENLQKPAANDAASAAAALKTLVDIEELSVAHCETLSVYSTSTPHDRSEGKPCLGPFGRASTSLHVLLKAYELAALTSMAGAIVAARQGAAARA